MGNVRQTDLTQTSSVGQYRHFGQNGNYDKTSFVDLLKLLAILRRAEDTRIVLMHSHVYSITLFGDFY